MSVSAVESEQLGMISTAAALGREAASIARYAIRSRLTRRTPERVSAEYDGGYWADVLRRRRWEQCDTLHEFIVPRSDKQRVARIDNRLVRITDADYYEYRLQMIRQEIGRSAAPGVPIVEIGCGYGANLFTLVETGQWPHLTGLDISSNALEAGRLIADRFGFASTVEFQRLDLLTDDAAWGRLTDATVFSYYAFEQLKHHTADVLRRIIAARPRRVIHIEPTPELWSLLNPKDAINRFYAWSHDYQDNLLATLRALEHEQRVRIVEVRRLFYAPGVRHDPTLICWEPR
ncbi:MAG: class I SAM-dependent methyltransferase [Acidobacteriota bacterium]